MPVSYTEAVALVAPSAAVPSTLAWGGSAWTNGSWVELLSAASVASALAGVSLDVADTTPFTKHFEVDIGVGGAGSEMVIATVKGRSEGNTSFAGPTQYTFPVAIASIAAGARLAARLRASAVVDVVAAVSYVPTSDTLITTTKPLKVVPSAANSVTVTAATTWNWSSWVEITSATSAAWVLAGAAYAAYANASGAWEMEIGTGSAGNEVALARVIGVGSLSLAGPTVGSFLPVPQTGIASGVRVAVRVRGDLDATEDGFAHLHYYEAPL
jgi:hypothetical protein